MRQRHQGGYTLTPGRCVPAARPRMFRPRQRTAVAPDTRHTRPCAWWCLNRGATGGRVHYGPFGGDEGPPSVDRRCARCRAAHWRGAGEEQRVTRAGYETGHSHARRARVCGRAVVLEGPCSRWLAQEAPPPVSLTHPHPLFQQPWTRQKRCCTSACPWACPSS